MNGNFTNGYWEAVVLFNTGVFINVFCILPLSCWTILLITRDVGGVASEVFTLNLAVSDIILSVGSVMIPLEIFAALRLGQASSFFSGFLIAGRPLFLCYICVERYLAVIHPLLFLRLRPLRYRAAGSAATWLVILSCGLILSFNAAFILYIWSTLCLTLFLVKLFCCQAILRALKRPAPGDRSKDRDGANQAKIKAFKVILFSLLSMSVSYLPLGVVMTIAQMMSMIQLGESAIFFLMAVTGLTHPLLYLQRVGKLKTCSSAAP